MVFQQDPCFLQGLWIGIRGLLCLRLALVICQLGLQCAESSLLVEVAPSLPRNWMFWKSIPLPLLLSPPYPTEGSAERIVTCLRQAIT
eukprot:scaffold12174_cov66-Cylindrotheca_fusiformis.AAC.1